MTTRLTDAEIVDLHITTDDADGYCALRDRQHADWINACLAELLAARQRERKILELIATHRAKPFVYLAEDMNEDIAELLAPPAAEPTEER